MLVGYDARWELTNFLAVLRMFLRHAVSNCIRASAKRLYVARGVLLLQLLDVRALEDIVLGVGDLLSGG